MLTLQKKVPIEIVELIVFQLALEVDETKRLNYLAACASVSRAWYICSMPLLWHRLQPSQADTIRLLLVNGLKDGKPLSPTLHFNNRFSLIQSIDLSKITLFNADITFYVQPVLMNCLEIRSLDLTHCLWIKDSDILCLLNCTKLEVLNLTGCGQLSDGMQLGLLLEYLPSLHTFILSGTEGLQDLLPVFQNCLSPLKRVSLFNLWRCVDFSIAVARLLERCCATLEELTLSNETMGLAAFASAENLPHTMPLRKLKLDGCSDLSGEAILRMSRHIGKLTHLSLSGCGSPQITPVSLLNLFECVPRLEYLDLSFVYCCRDDAIRFLCQVCRQLTHLYLKHNSFVSDQSLMYIGEGLSETLRCISLDGNNNITRHGLNMLLRNCRQLEKVSLDCCENFVDNEFEEFVRSLSPEYQFFSAGTIKVNDAVRLGKVREFLENE
ncbi:hypothetical protein HDU97_004296 [Phlyctochytrium planicorne]|nr:hypothetical protein HDU97_004296 [Phlyctochytrium planicorne]